ncbi:MAG: flagellar biosynthesis protein FlhA [Rhizobiaceae bacterium]|jgi:flagellar biosynthesis protein FlhA|nr:flagellar biosynthesis protein FlhA [Rhizobiaceae bacterium]
MTDFSLNPTAQPQADNSRDVIFAIGILVILAVLFLPMPPIFIDIGLAISIALSVLILMVALWINKPLDFSSFPTILLIATMIRLSLNISTTRLILSNGNEGESAAGGIIEGFASFVMGGDFVIGVIVFIILIVVNFMVITKGATRIAEVGARFTLDAIPGKQMAIDADLSAGLLDEKEAQLRRRELEEESSFFGAMDGASKFVRGDAIAGLIITAINVVGGIIIGVWRYGMEFSEAADVFVKLSVGDGLVSQIPALIISLGAGLLVSKGGTRGAAETAVLGQLTNYPKALYMAAGLLFILAVTPNLPFLPFALLATLTASSGYVISNTRRENARLEQHQKEDNDKKKKAEEQDSVKHSLELPEVELVIGRQLQGKVITEEGEMGFRISRMRKKFAKAYGFVIPEIKISQEMSLKPRSYQIKIFGTTVASSEVSLTDVMVIANKETPPPFPHEEIVEPAFNTKAWRIPDSYSAELKEHGYKTVDPMSQILTHVSEVIRNNLSQLFSYKDMRRLIDGMDKEYLKLVEEICPTHLSFSGLQAVFKLLLAERVSVRNVPMLLEAIAEVAPYSKRGEQIVAHVRTRISQQICGDLLQDGQLKLLRLGDEWELAFANALKKDQRGEIVDFQMGTEQLEKFGVLATRKIQALIDDRQVFALSTSPENRSYVRMIVERIFPTLPVISNLEIARGMDVKIIGSVAE